MPKQGRIFALYYYADPTKAFPYKESLRCRALTMREAFVRFITPLMIDKGLHKRYYIGYLGSSHVTPAERVYKKDPEGIYSQCVQYCTLGSARLRNLAARKVPLGRPGSYEYEMKTARLQEKREYARVYTAKKRAYQKYRDDLISLGCDPLPLWRDRIYDEPWLENPVPRAIPDKGRKKRREKRMTRREWERELLKERGLLSQSGKPFKDS